MYLQVYRKASINTTSISTTLIIMVELFVTTAQLVWGQIHPAGENSSHGKNLILQFNRV